MTLADGEGPHIKDGDVLGGGVDGEIDCGGVGDIGGTKPSTFVVGINDGDGVGLMDGLVVVQTTVGITVKDGECIKDGIFPGESVEGRHVGGIVGIVDDTIVCEGVGIEEGLLSSGEVVSNVDDDGVGESDCAWLGSLVGRGHGWFVS